MQTAPITVRPATRDDLATIYDIWYQLEVEGDPNPPAPGPMASGLVYELEAGALLVAEQSGRMVGFAGAVSWDAPNTADQQGDARQARNANDALTYLGDLFIRREAQSSGVGRALLERILPRDGGTLAVLASTDPRAVALYVRAGMRPLWPNIWLRANNDLLAQRIDTLPGADLDVIHAAPADAALAQWDTGCFGRARPRDLTYLVERRDALPVWFTRAGEPVGYGYIQRRSDESLWSPDAYTIGPVGARTEDDAAACVCAAVRWACAHAPAARLGVPGPHPALTPLIQAGCHITYVEMFLASRAKPFANAGYYLPSGVFL